MSKLFNILALGKTRKVGFLTVDGSPHCIQMHFASKYLKRGLKVQNIEYKHFVIQKDGKVFEVKVEEIDRAKDLAVRGREIKILEEFRALRQAQGKGNLGEVRGSAQRLCPAGD